MPFLRIPRSGRVQHHLYRLVVNRGEHVRAPAPVGVEVPTKGQAANPLDCGSDGLRIKRTLLQLRRDPRADVEDRDDELPRHGGRA